MHRKDHPVCQIGSETRGAIIEKTNKKARGSRRGLIAWSRRAHAATAAGSFFSHSSPQIITAWPGETSRYWRTGGT